MRRSSVWVWYWLCVALLLLLAGSGALHAAEPSTPSKPPASMPSSRTLDSLSQMLSDSIATLKARLIERSREVESLRIELAALQAELLETSSLLQRSADSLASMSSSYERYRLASQATIAEQAQEITALQRRLRVERILSGTAIAAALAGLVYLTVR